MTTGWPLALLWACAGIEQGFEPIVPVVAVSPEILDFGEVVAGSEPAVLEVYVQNIGEGLLDVRSLEVTGDDAAAFAVVGEAAFEDVPTDEGVTVPIRFTPSEVRTYEATLAVASNDPERQLLAVALSGVGRVPYAPDIEVPTDCVDFGSVAVGETVSRIVGVRNAGDADLQLGSIVQEGSGGFALLTDVSGFSVPPGQGNPLTIEYTAYHDGGDSGTLRIPSDDADEPEVTICLVANGGGDGAAFPDARIACPGTVDLAGPVVIELDGSASTDPGASPLTYAWSMVRRPSAADPDREVEPSDAPVAELLVDAAGLWEVQLVVTNLAGLPSVPEKCVIDAIPRDALHVELSWSGATSDLDLHLATDGADFYGVPGDVSWCNASPDWGVAGDPEDDPRLDVDDHDGYGPENVNIAAPADGGYDVRVHLFDDADDGLVTATVSVWTYGELEWEGSKVMSRNEVWEAGRVNWPDGTFGESIEPLWDPQGTRECP